MTNLLEQFVTLWVVIDPIGTVPVFIAVTAMLSAKERRRTAFQAALVATCVLAFFLVFGQIVIDALGIGLYSFQVAGGIVLFMFALTMIFGEPKSETDQRDAVIDEAAGIKAHSVAVFPLAVPSLASPGAMLAVVMLTDNNDFGVAEQAVTAAVMGLVIFLAWIVMLLADPVIRLIGHAGAAIVSRVMGMILASVAADAVLSALLHILETGQL